VVSTVPLETDGEGDNSIGYVGICELSLDKNHKPDINRYVITARGELRKVLFLAPSVCFLFVHEMSRD